jgi:outer membrane lipoprotein carrier protein
MHRRPAVLLSPALAACLVVGLCAGPPAAAQDEPVTAEVVAARVQAFYDRTESVRVDFQQHYWSNVYRRTTTSRGRLAILRPGRIRFDYTTPTGKVVVSDGDNFTYYEPGDDGGAGQYWVGSADGTSTALGFLTGTARLDRDYTFSLGTIDPATEPAQSDELVLRPRSADPHYTEIRLFVSNAPGTEGVVLRASICDHENNWNRFDFSGFRFTEAIPASTFEYTPPEGSREITPPSE